MVGAICHYDVTSEKGTQGTRPRKASSAPISDTVSRATNRAR